MSNNNYPTVDEVCFGCVCGLQYWIFADWECCFFSVTEGVMMFRAVGHDVNFTVAGIVQ